MVHIRLKKICSELDNIGAFTTPLLQPLYRKITEELGYQVLPNASLVNNLGQYDMAGELLALNVRNYPQDANPQDSYGDYYLAKGDNDNAMICFKKALAIKEIPETRAKLNLLLKDK